LEIIPPRPFVDPSAVVVDWLPPPDPHWPFGWPGSFGWVNFPTNIDSGLDLVKPKPRKKKKKEPPPPVIPEPDTATLLVLGLIALGIGRRHPA
jgi:hypothetical protein